MIQIRIISKAEDGRISPEEYSVVASFWTKRAATPPPRNLLPTLGVFADRDGEAAACGFLYLDATGSGAAWIAWTATNPDLPPMAGGRALHHVLNFLEIEAAKLGYFVIVGTLAAPGFISLMERRGYRRGDQGLCHLFKCITPESQQTS